MKGIQVCSALPFSKGRCLRNSGNTLLKFKNLLLQSPTRSISTRLGTTHPVVKVTQGFTIRTIQLSKRRWWVFFFPNQHYDIIIALSKCVYWFELVSHVSKVAHGPLVQTCFPMAILLTISMIPVTGLELRGTTLCSPVLHPKWRDSECPVSSTGATYPQRQHPVPHSTTHVTNSTQQTTALFHHVVLKWKLTLCGRRNC